MTFTHVSRRWDSAFALEKQQSLPVAGEQAGFDALYLLMVASGDSSEPDQNTLPNARADKIRRAATT